MIDSNYVRMMLEDDHLLRDIGLTRSDVHLMMSGRSKATRAHE